MKKEVLRFEHITKMFDSLHGLKSLSFCLFEGEILGVAGMNSAGKSTLANLIAGTRVPESGAMYLRGNLVNIFSAKAARALGIYHIGPTPDLVPALSIAENLSLFSNHFFIRRKREAAEISTLLNDMHLPFQPDTICQSLTLPQQHLVQIAKGVANDCQIIMIDDVTNAYSPNELAVFISTLQLVVKRSISVILISQLYEQLFSACDRILLLRDGQYAGQMFHEDYQREKFLSLLTGHAYQELISPRRTLIGDVVFCAESLVSNSLHNLTFSVRQGEILGITDITHSNSMALPEVLTGKEFLLSGSISICGKKLTALTAQNLVAHDIGIITSRTPYYGLFPNMGLTENLTTLMMPKLSRFGFLRPNLYAYVKKEFFKSQEGLPDPTGFPSDFSLTPKENVLIVLEQWRVAGVKVLFLADLTQDLDIVARKAVWQRIEEIAHMGISVVLLSSDFTELTHITDRFIILENGSIIKELPGTSRLSTVL